MAYTDFTTLTKVREAFGLTIEESIDLFTDIPEVLPSSHLQTTLKERFSKLDQVLPKSSNPGAEQTTVK